MATPFVQGFSKLYWRTKVMKRERAEFIGERTPKDGVNVPYGRNVDIGGNEGESEGVF